MHVMCLSQKGTVDFLFKTTMVGFIARFLRTDHPESNVPTTPTRPTQDVPHGDATTMVSPTQDRTATPLRRLTLNWYFSKVLPQAYVDVKGQPQHFPKGHLCECNIFADTCPPEPSAGEPMDLHLDTTNNAIYARLNDDWVKWE